MAVERTLILIKPDAVERSLAGEILARIERRGFRVVGGKLLRVSRELGEKHYAEHAREAVLRRARRVHHLRAHVGARRRGRRGDRDDAQDDRRHEPGRRGARLDPGDLATSMPNNLVHGSDSPESAEREIALWFSDDELV